MNPIKRGARTMVKLIIYAFLVVALSQVLASFGILGDSFIERVLVTLIALIIASILLWIATESSRPLKEAGLAGR